MKRPQKNKRSPLRRITRADGTTVSWQRTWQIKQREKGLCEICTQPSQGRTLCDECAKRRDGVKKRRPLKSVWKTIDWSESDGTIAARLGVTLSAVCYQRRKNAPDR